MAYDVRWRVGRLLVNKSQQLEKEAKDAKLKLTVPQREKSLREALSLKHQAKEQYVLAAEALRRYLPRDPTNPMLRFHLADALNKAGQKAECRKEAREALRLDDMAAPPRNLANPQREQAEQWLKPDSAS